MALEINSSEQNLIFKSKLNDKINLMSNALDSNYNQHLLIYFQLKSEHSHFNSTFINQTGRERQKNLS